MKRTAYAKQLNRTTGSSCIFSFTDISPKGNFFIMKTWVRKTLSVGVLAAGALLVAPTAAQAEIGMVSWDNDGIANGTQVAVPVQVPVNVCGVGVGAAVGLGFGQALCSNGAVHDVNVGDDDNGGSQYWAADHKAAKKAKKAKYESTRTEGAFLGSFDNDGIANGTQVYAPIQVPVNVCGVGVGALVGLGAGSAECSNGAAHDVNVEESGRTEGAWMLTGDNDGILNGTQVYAPIQVPINACGIGIGVLGLGFGAAECSNGAAHDVNIEESARTEGLGMVSGDNDGILNGTQIALPIQVPVNACGIGVGALVGLGAGTAACSNGAAWDVNVDEDDNGSSYGRHSRKEFLPVGGGLTSGLPVLGGSELPALGGNFAKGSQMNVAGVDPTQFLAGLPTA
jgi:hypothetical protein